MGSKKELKFTVNGQPYEVFVKPNTLLVEVIRNELGLTGTKRACNSSSCGACTVIMNGKAVLSCGILTVECNGAEITTIEGLRNPETGALDPLQQAFIDHTAFQCGYCTPGMIMTSKVLLMKNPHPSEEEIKEALSGNFCRCVSHYNVLKAVMSVTDTGE